MTNSTILTDIDRLERGMADLLLAAYDAGYCHGAGIAMESPQNPRIASLLTALAARHQIEVLVMRAWAEPPHSRQIPAWLRALAAEDAGETAPLGNGR